MSVMDLLPANIQAKATKLAIELGILVVAFAAGYLYKTHLVELDQAAQQATQKTAQTTTDAAGKAADTQAVDRLRKQLASTLAQAQSLQKQIEDERNARKMAGSSADCRVSDGLRDEINRNLTAH